ncbi:MAG: chemotaxis protein CheX [Armatimonadetes bacterium]|nr:chemotaxis protein CheX [Armatimonadota bacterium]
MPRFFGQYLLEKGLLTREQLLNAINYQKSKVQRLGELALSKGFLTQEDLVRIHAEQQRTDMMFGELAVQLGLLSAAQLSELVTMQKASHIYLGQAITDLNYLTMDQIELELRIYQEEESTAGAEELKALDALSGTPEGQIFFTFVDLTIKMYRRIADILVKLGEAREEKGYTVNSFLSNLIQFRGDYECKFLMKMSKNVASRIAERFLKTTDPEEYLVIDATCEFLNIVCGNVSAKLMQMGKNVEISAPQPIRMVDREVIEFKPSESATVFPLFTTEGFAEIQIIRKGSGRE